MKLVNARGMDTELYQFKEDIENRIKSYFKALSFTQTLESLQDNHLEYQVDITDDSLTVRQNDNIILSLKEHDREAEAFIESILGEKLDIYTLNQVSDIFVETYLKTLEPQWDQKFEDFLQSDIGQNLINGLFVEMLNFDPEMQNHNDSFSEQLPKLFKYAKLQNSEKFYYNDLDNYFYMQDSNLILGNQNYEYTLSYKDGLYSINVSIDSEDKDDSLHADFTFNNKGETKLDFQVLDQPFVISHFMLDLQSAVESYEVEHALEVIINPVVKTYDYHLAYMSQNYGLSREEIIWRMAFYCFPAGTDESGNYVYDSRENLPYQKKSEQMMKDIDQKITHSEFKVPVSYKNNKIFKKMKNLNEDWTRFFLEAHTLVADFLVRYQDASAKKKKDMSYTEAQEIVPDLEEFLVVTQKLISPKKKTVKIKSI